jgi:hypothetical protein
MTILRNCIILRKNREEERLSNNKIINNKPKYKNETIFVKNILFFIKLRLIKVAIDKPTLMFNHFLFEMIAKIRLSDRRYSTELERRHQRISKRREPITETSYYAFKAFF